MAADYDALVGKVRDWANRDSDTLPNSIIIDALDYAADTIYRELRIPVLEASFQYTVDDVITSNSSQALLDTLPFTLPDDTSVIPVPQDLSEFIQLKMTGVSLGQSGGVSRAGADTVINIKADLRTFEDFFAERYDRYVWTRKGDHILFRPALTTEEEGTVVELFYYRRLPDLDARYDATLANANNISGTFLTDVEPVPSDIRTNEVVPTITLFARAADDPATPAYYAADTDPSTRTETVLYGLEAPNWLRDQNEKAVLFGALHQCFDYLGEDQMSAKYLQKAGQEIESLNREEELRRNSGGNQQINFNGDGLI